MPELNDYWLESDDDRTGTDYRSSPSNLTTPHDGSQYVSVHSPDSALIAAHAATIAKIGEKYAKLAKKFPDHPVAARYLEAVDSIYSATVALTDLKTSVLNGEFK